jgi:ligand-binding SRPBCC domain-containing protein
LTVKLRFEQSVAAPREKLFAFHCDPENMALLLRGWKGFELLAHDGHIRVGARMRIRQAVGLLRQRITFEQFVFEPPVRFGKRQVQGWFTRFEHLHEFLATADATTIVDRIELTLPWYLGGALAERWIVAPVLRRFFVFRQGAYQRLCESGRFR